MLLVMAIPRARGAKNTSISCALYFWTLGTLVNKFLVNCNKLLGKTKKNLETLKFVKKYQYPVTHVVCVM